MPRKTFVAGEILTASDVNTNLMDQAVMVFDDDAARSAAIPTPSEGMISYLKDSDQLFKYTTAWVPAGGLVQTKTVLKTNVQSSSVAAGASVAVTDLTISHAMSNAGNKVVLFAQIAANSSNNDRAAGLVLTGGGTALALGDATASRTRTGGNVGVAPGGRAPSMGTLVLVHSPATVSSVTYGVNLVNVDTSTNTLYVNRSANDDDGRSSRSVCSLTLMEVAV